MEIEFTSLAQAHAVYDVVEHRVLTVSPDATLPESEVAEVMELVGFMLRLSPMIKNDTEESLMPAGALHNYRELRIAKALTSTRSSTVQLMCSATCGGHNNWPGSDSLVTMQRSLVGSGMAIADYRVSERGQMALPAEARRRWNIADGGTVEVADLGDALVIVPAGRGGLRSIVSSAIVEAGGYEALAAKVSQEEPELA